MRVLVLALLFLAAPAAAQITAEPPAEGDATYRPQSGQAGKDVIWVPTPAALVTAMLKAARTGPNDIVIDLGSGDGRIPVAAAREFGARAHGIEYNGDMVALANREARRAGVANRVTFAQADIFATDFSRATVLTLYLLPDLNLKLRPTIQRMRPGTRVVAHAFDMGDWQPDETIQDEERTAFLWIVPARLEGRWRLMRAGRAVDIDLVQTHQMLRGRADGPVREGRVRGDAVTLVLADGARLEGQVGEGGLTGAGWTARRVG